MSTSTMDRIFEAAAEARAVGVAAPADRPSQRRCAEDPGSRAAAFVRAERIEIRAAGDDGSGLLHFDGFASVYNRGYEMWDMFGPYSEQVTSGAGAESLARADLDVPFVLAHDSLRRIARTTNGTLTLSERTVDDVEGLHVDAPALDATDSDVAYIAPKLRSGLIDEMSFRFRILVGSWSPDWTEYHIEKYDIHRGDVAIVGYGANPHTQGSGLRAQQMPRLEDMTEGDLRAFENKLHAERTRRGLPADLSSDQRAAKALLGLR
ncbi:MAG: phage prohead protease [Actinobacteria bacterium]|nr:phage prohead protease [Actinomycetota bacterium]